MKSTVLMVAIAATALSACERAADSAASDTGPASREASTAPPAMPRTPAPDGARVFIASPADGAELSGPFTVSFGADDLVIVPAGDTTPRSGHHHLLINTDLPDPNLPIPADAAHIHFGKGQTETTLELPPGEYTLQLLLGDHNHVPHQPPIVSAPVRVTVIE